MYFHYLVVLTIEAPHQWMQCWPKCQRWPRSAETGDKNWWNPWARYYRNSVKIWHTGFKHYDRLKITTVNYARKLCFRNEQVARWRTRSRSCWWRRGSSTARTTHSATMTGRAWTRTANPDESFASCRVTGEQGPILQNWFCRNTNAVKLRLDLDLKF